MRPKKKKPQISINNRLKEFGNEEGGKIQINVKKHRGDKAELADTLKHELNHMKQPRASEKAIQKKTKKEMAGMSYAEKEALANKVRNKKNHYAQGALKRKFKMGRGKVEPGSYIKAMNNAKVSRKTNKAKASNFKLGVEALI